MIPKLDENGLLPPGIWDCTLTEVASRFATNPHRRDLWMGLLRFLDAEVRPHGVLPVWIDGGFTRRREMPEDIDVTVDFSALPSGIAMPLAISLYTRNSQIKSAYHVDAYPRHPDVPNDFAVFFQYVGPKAAAEFQIDPKQPKGILRVQP